ncbi:MAG: type II toxin-antitoxin system HicA family toxin [Spirochaetales bacterium]|nr:type II toxin-antitoxin system HicA family toxin [Spirochaetales bacterium]
MHYNISRFPVCKSKEIIRILEKIGFRFHRQKGSHCIYIKDDKMVIIPMHNRDLKLPTQNNIIKGTGLTQEEFFSYK